LRVLDHALRLWLRDRERRDYALLLSEHGPGLPGLGVLVVGYWPLLVSDFRRGGWYSGVSFELLVTFGGFVLTGDVIQTPHTPVWSARRAL
jgi:hypothetical protein